MTKVGLVKLDTVSQPSEKLCKKTTEEMWFNYSEGMTIGDSVSFSLKPDNKTSIEKDFARQLAPYGIKTRQVECMFNKAEEKEIEGKKYLVLTSTEESFKLSIPLDENFKPENIWAFGEKRCGEAGPYIEGVHGGILEQTSDVLPNPDEYPYYDDYKGIRIVNSEITFFGKYGSPDLVVLDNSNVTFVTDDYADAYYKNDELKTLKPGIHELINRKQ